MTTYTTFRTAFDHLTPTTLVSIIVDATAPVSFTPRPQDMISAAWDALLTNVGTEDAIDMAVDAGISLDDLDGAS